MIVRLNWIHIWCRLRSEACRLKLIGRKFPEFGFYAYLCPYNLIMNMKKQHLLSLSLMAACLLPMQAQISYINPVPQQVTTSKDGCFDVPAQWNLVSSAPEYITAGLKGLVPVSAKADFKVVVGTRGDKSVKSYAKKIPAHAEGYYLHVDKKGIVVAGYDERGTLYGVKSLEAMIGGGQLEGCDIADYPDVAWRGVVEGFYGTPWSHEARMRQLDFYGMNKLNVYLYGPKDDPYHSVPRWREPYPEKEAAQLKQLVEEAHKNGVVFYWAIHPGQDIKWNTEDRDKLMHKFELMYQLGVRAFAVFFDDISGEGTRADKQAELLNYLDDHFVKAKKDVAPLVMCPTEYNRAWSSDKTGYLRTLGKKLNKSIEVMWTGNSVVHCIDKPSLEWINERIERKAYIWWNYPVSDFVRDHLLMGPVYGNGLDIAGDMSAFVSNPMERAEASKVALYSIADYTWNMEQYDSIQSWHRSLMNLLPRQGKQLEVFARHCSDLGQNGHGFRREESVEMMPVINRLKAAGIGAAESDLKAFAGENEAVYRAANILLADDENKPLMEEIRPWLLQANLVGQYGSLTVQMMEWVRAHAADSKADDFLTLYDCATALQKQMYDVDTQYNQNPYQPGVKYGSKEMLPTAHLLFQTAVSQFNKEHGTNLNATTTYNPNKLQTTVGQLKLLPLRAKGNTVSISPSNEVVTWQAADYLTVEMENEVTLSGLDFDFGTENVASLFKLETSCDGKQWQPVGLVQSGGTTVHTTDVINGMKAKYIRLTNISEKELKLYFRSFRFSKK